MSTSSSAECAPSGAATAVRRNSSSTPKAKAAARVPPPENVSTSSVLGSLRGCATPRSIRYPAPGTYLSSSGVTGRTAQPAKHNSGRGKREVARARTKEAATCGMQGHGTRNRCRRPRLQPRQCVTANSTSSAMHAASSMFCVSSTRSGASGSSYGLSMPVKPLISPRRAFPYRPFGIARFAGGESGLHVHLIEAARTRRGSRPRAVVVERRDERRDADEARVGEQRRHFADAPDVLLPVLRREAQIGIESAAHVVAVDGVRGPAAVEKRALERHRQRGLAGAGQAGQPQDGAGVAGTRAALGRGDVVIDARRALRLVARSE